MSFQKTPEGLEPEAYHIPVAPYDAPYEHWTGQQPACEGSIWQLSPGVMQSARRFEAWFGGGDVLDADQDGVLDTLVSADVTIHGTHYVLYGLHYPTLHITDVVRKVYLRSEADAPALLAKEIDAIKSPEFRACRFGRLFFARIGDCLNFTYTPPEGVEHGRNPGTEKVGADGSTAGRKSHKSPGTRVLATSRKKAEQTNRGGDEE